MTPSVSKKTQQYLEELEEKETSRATEPVAYYGHMDALDKQIYQDGIRIKKLLVDKDLDVILLLLNTGKVIQRDLSDFFDLDKLSESQLEEYECDGLSIFWPALDVDLSLRGFLGNNAAASSSDAKAA